MLSIAFGAYNCVAFKKNIVPNFNLFLYYVFTMLCLIATIVQCWQPTEKWYQLD